MNQYEDFDFEGFDERKVRREARRFEEMLKRDEFHYFDLITIDEIYHHYLRSNQLKQALRLITFALEQYPSNDDLHFKQASVFLDLGKVIEASYSIERALSLNPLCREYRFLKAEILSAAGEFDHALHELQRLLEDGSDEAEIWYQMGSISQFSGNFEKARACFRTALSLDPSMSEAVFDLSFLLESEGKVADAVRVCEEYLNGEPFSFMGWYYLGGLYMRSDLFEEAIDAYDYAVAIKDDFAPAWQEKALAYMEQEKYDEALKSFFESLVHQPTDHSIHLHIGECYEELGRVDLAKRYYLKSADKPGTESAAWYRIGSALESEDKYHEAVHYYKKTIDRDPEHFEARLALAICEYQLGNPISAYDALQAALTLNAHDLTLWQDWAEILYEDDNPAGALTFLEEGIRVNPEAAELYYHSAAYHFASGSITKGSTMLENALLLDYDKHSVLFDIFEDLKNIPSIVRLISQYRP